jgi:hypothetical protein
MFLLQARMKLPKRRRRVVAVEQPRRQQRRMGQGSIGTDAGGNNGSGLQRRMNAIKGSGHNATNHTASHNSPAPSTTFRLPSQMSHDKMGKFSPELSRG